MNQRSLADRVGGLVMIGFEGTTAAQLRVDVVGQFAGVILFKRNIVSAEQTAGLVRDIQAAREGGEPCIVAIDQEGGTVSRLADIGTTIPSAMALGATGDPSMTESVYRVTGDELAALGVTLDFAPVADLNTDPMNPVIGVRSFGDRPEAAARHVVAAVNGLHQAGVGATAKHFPGHGHTMVDSHFDLPVVAIDLARMRAVEFVPFRAAIACGVDAIMAAHIATPRIDPSGTPASLSRTVLTTILREELDFPGVICTDCMQMRAVADRYPAGEAAVMAVTAGADLVLYSSSLDAATEAIAALSCAVLDGRIDAEQIERSLARVAQLRNRFTGVQRGNISGVGGDAHRASALAAARKAVTMVRDPDRVLPLRFDEGQRIFLVQFGGDAATPAENHAMQSTAFGKLLAVGPARVQEQHRSLDPAGHEYKQLLMASGSADAIVAVTRRAFMHPLQARAVADLALAGKPLVVVAAREPYDAAIAPPSAAVLAAYGDDAATVEATVDVILGARSAEGTLPVEVASAAPAVAGVHP